KRSPSSQLGLLIAASVVDASVAICATLVSAVSASVSLPMRARSQALRSLLGNHMDQIATMITHIVNAGNAGRDHTVVNYSTIKADIAEVLKDEGFIKGYKKETKAAKSFLSLDLFVENRVPKVKGVKRHSKPSKRVYKKASEIRAVKQGY